MNKRQKKIMVPHEEKTDTCLDCSNIPCDCGIPAGYTPTPRTDEQRKIIDSIRPDGCHRVEYLLGFASILETELAAVTEQRDEARRLAEKYRNLSCDSQEEADETLLPWENNQPKPESKDPHRFCRGGGGNNFHCGCKYDG